MNALSQMLAIGLLTAATAHAATPLQDENLLQPMPPGYRIANSGRQGSASLTEMIPSGETLDNWTEMITTQIYYGAKDASIQAYRNQMEQRWKAACDSTEVIPLADGQENGYDFQFWMQTCRFKDDTRKPEITWFKMIRGNDSAYVVQKAFHVEPTKEQVVATAKYMKTVKVCDSRLPDRACPAR